MPSPLAPLPQAGEGSSGIALSARFPERKKPLELKAHVGDALIRSRYFPASWQVLADHADIEGEQPEDRQDDDRGDHGPDGNSA